MDFLRALVPISIGSSSGRFGAVRFCFTPGRPEAATKYSRLVAAARFQHSALSFLTQPVGRRLISAVS